MAGAPTSGGPIEAGIRERLTAAFAPTHLDMVNESHKHSVPPGSESHFKVTVVSDGFTGKAPLARHRAVNAAVAVGGELPIHALSIKAATTAEWAALCAAGAGEHTTPPCKGGAGK
jgi:stress-induced morphogen